VKFPARQLEISGAELEQLLHRLIAFGKYLRLVERKCPDRALVLALLDRDVRDRGFFADRNVLEDMAAALASDARTVRIERDEEHNSFFLVLEDRSNGYPRHATASADLVSTSEYRTLLASYRDVKGLDGPIVVSAQAQAAAEAAGEEPEEAPGTAGTDDTTFGGVPVDPATKLAAEPRRGSRAREQDVTLDSLDALVEFFIAAGKKGVTVNRYKGLGEMNPEQLWDTTMKPEVRTLLQVRAEDHAEADLMFTTLMGDQVEPRRRFIEENALDVKNLDV
jgi:DNA gyrase subunit B